MKAKPGVIVGSRNEGIDKKVSIQRTFCRASNHDNCQLASEARFRWPSRIGRR